MQGDFDDCGVDIPVSDLRAYLERADELSSDYYVGMLIEELLEDVAALEAAESG